ncbi:hypothetical protein [Falsiroseomonas ponticola]|uniref:hypothetical protein n=1 Tax=Falsiroseomonas ponticola TaxID=2786951 RepID=UPI0019315014|nr:hypothetical protein [Roseomonas ponticola]
MPRHPPWPPRPVQEPLTPRRLLALLRTPGIAAECRAPLLFGALALSVLAIDLLGPGLGLGLAVPLLHAAAGYRLPPLAGAVIAGGLACLAWLIL